MTLLTSFHFAAHRLAHLYELFHRIGIFDGLDGEVGHIKLLARVLAQFGQKIFFLHEYNFFEVIGMI